MYVPYIKKSTTQLAENDWAGFAPNPPCNLGQWFWSPADLSTIKKWHLKHVLSRSSWFTPWKINMEPTNHPFRKENDLPNLHDYVPCWSSGVYHLFYCFAEVPNFQTSFNTNSNSKYQKRTSIKPKNKSDNIRQATKKRNCIGASWGVFFSGLCESRLARGYKERLIGWIIKKKDSLSFNDYYIIM